MSRADVAVQGFWSQLRKGRKAKPTVKRQATVTLPGLRYRELDAPNSARAAAALAAHRELIELQYFKGNRRRIRLLREAAAAFDAQMARDRAAKKGGRPKKVTA